MCKSLLVFQKNYVCISYYFWDIQHQIIVLRNRGKGCSRSLNMAPFDRSYTTYYWSAIVSIALSCHIFFSYLTWSDIVTLKSGLMVTQGHWKWYHSKAWVRFIRLLQQLWLYLVPFWRKSEILVENRDLFIRPCIGRPRQRGSRRNITKQFRTKKNYDGLASRRWKNFNDMFSRFDRIPACDRQMDRRTDILSRHSLRYAYASRGKNLTDSSRNSISNSRKLTRA